MQALQKPFWLMGTSKFLPRGHSGHHSNGGSWDLCQAGNSASSAVGTLRAQGTQLCIQWKTAAATGDGIYFSRENRNQMEHGCCVNGFSPQEHSLGLCDLCHTTELGDVPVLSLLPQPQV